MSYIFYTGIGSKKSGKHTEKEFLRIMKKEVNQSCTIHKTRAASPACIKEKQMLKRIETPTYRASLKRCVKGVKKACKVVEKANTAFDKRHGKTRKRYGKRCINETLKNNQEPCTLDEYIEYSGANRVTQKI